MMISVSTNALSLEFTLLIYVYKPRVPRYECVVNMVTCIGVA